MENENTSIFPIQLRAIYAKILNSGGLGRIRPHRIMEKVYQTALARNENFPHAVFQSLFQHDFNKLNTLIANTEELQANNIDELAVVIGEKGGKLLEKIARNPLLAHLLQPVTSSRPASERPAATAMQKAIKKATLSAGLAGYHAQPGIARVMLPISVTGVAGLKYTAVHESMHAYSASPNFVGLRPEQFIQRDNPALPKNNL